MKKSLVILTVLALSLLFSQNVFAQTATQALKLEVQSVYRVDIANGASAVNLTINDGIAGVDTLTSGQVTGNAYKLTHNNKTNGAKITAELSTALDPAMRLWLTLGASGGTSTMKNIGQAVQTVVTDIPSGAHNTQAMTYELVEDASFGTYTSAGNTLTLTLTSN